MASRQPSLTTLLSQALVAFTIELDNEFEHRMPHRTTNHGQTEGAEHVPWLVSSVMYVNCMQFVTDKGLTVRELGRRAKTGSNLAGMHRWGYIRLDPSPKETRAKQPGLDATILPTKRGLQAKKIWASLYGEIEERWRKRFGGDCVDALRDALWAVDDQIDLDLPDCLPILGYGLSTPPHHFQERSPGDGDGSHLTLSALLSKPLLLAALDYEGRAELSLPIVANTLRVLAEGPAKGMAQRNLPAATGTSKESISSAVKVLEKGRLLSMEDDPDGGRSKLARLTAKGQEGATKACGRLGRIEAGWKDRFGKQTVDALHAALEPMVGDGGPSSLLFEGLEPYDDGWRASVPQPKVLPAYPVVLHRGGFPDGS